MNWLIVIICLSLAGLFGAIACFEEGQGRWVATVIATVFAIAALVVRV